MKEKSRDNLAFPLDGLTSLLQPSDVSVIKPFKDYMCNMYEKWMASVKHWLTPTGKINRAPLETV